MIWKLPWRSKMYAGDLKSVYVIRKLSGLSEKCPYHLKGILIIWKVSGWSEKCLDDLICILVIWKVSISSEKDYPVYLKSVHIIWRVSGLSEKWRDDLKSVWMTLKEYFAKHKSRFFLSGIGSEVAVLSQIWVRRSGALSKKFSRRKSCYPKSFCFFRLW